jgi:hypothetical protein
VLSLRFTQKDEEARLHMTDNMTDERFYESTADYYADKERLNNGAINRYIESSAMYFHEYIRGDLKRETTPDMLLGQAIHCFMLEPSKFCKEFAVAPKCDRRTKEGKATWQQFVDQFGSAKLLDSEQMAIVEGVAGSLVEHEYANKIFVGDVQRICERGIKFEYAGMKAKALPDMVLPDSQLIVDLKTTNDPSPAAFRRYNMDNGRHRQAFWYRQAVRSIYDADFEFLFVAVRNRFPYEIATYTLTDEMYSIAKAEVDAAIGAIQTSIVTNNWAPAYSEGTIRLGPSKFYVPFVGKQGGFDE